MRCSVITPNYNGSTYLEACLQSVIEQRDGGVELEYIVVDGESTDGSLDIIGRYRDHIDTLIVEADTGPANALNKGMKKVTGDIVSWLNSDDIYFPRTLDRVRRCLQNNDAASFCFGRCPIINENGEEIRQAITGFKEWFFPVSSRFAYRSINYISQPALFFRRDIIDHERLLLREDMVAAWDYEFFLRLWRYGSGAHIPGDPLAAFRWHGESISGRHFSIQFREELEAALRDSGRFSVPGMLHRFVRWGIVVAYRVMAMSRKSG